MKAMTHTIAAAALSVVLTYPAVAVGEELSGTYPVALTEVANNCDADAITLDTEELTLRSAGDDEIAARLSTIPEMTGEKRRGGRFRAEVQTQDSPIDDAEAAYSIAGRIRGDRVQQLILIAEHYRDDRPLCTQSWNGRADSR